MSNPIEQLISNRILILDGAMGTMIQRFSLTEEDFRGKNYAHCTCEMKGNNDVLVITRPDVITKIHEAYLDAGADIIETDTFNANAISQSDYGLSDDVYLINKTAAELAKKAAIAKTLQTPNKPRFVAGSIGPTNKTCSMSPDVENPAFRAISFDEMVDAYTTQIEGLIDGGVDALLIETIFDTLNAKAAIFAAENVKLKLNRDIPLMLSVTISEGGRTLSGQTLEAFLSSVQHANILSVGLNCSFGAADMLAYVEQLSKISPYYISAYPNAGLPNRFGEYDETPEIMAGHMAEYVNKGLVNIIGGCCGTTPEHIAMYQALVANGKPHAPLAVKSMLTLSGLEHLNVCSENNFVNIGERCNVAGSRKFLRLINEKKYDEALSIARAQVEAGAQVIDINMDDAMLDAKAEMVTFLNLIASEPDIARIPIMIDSSKWDVILAGLKCVQGKAIVNSISLKEGEDIFISHAKQIRSMGAAVVVMAFDEIGQADTYQRKIEVCGRAYKILTHIVGMSPEDIIFDPNILALATGIEEHNNYGIDFIKATKWIKDNLPGSKVSGGISNLSFSFRGYNYLREAMHSVFLYHAIHNGMDMGIVNPATSVMYDDIDEQLRTAIENVVLNRDSNATERLVSLAESTKDNSVGTISASEANYESMSIDDKLAHALVKGLTDNLESLVQEALTAYGSAVSVIDKPLMGGMNRVGELFGSGKMFLPQVVKSARTMKQAVTILQPYIEQEKAKSASTTAGKCIIATVKGDVHDIGKNIVGVILACNNYEVIDLGVMVPAEEIIHRAKEEKVDFIGLSGLITPSLEEMCHVASLMESEGMHIPLLIGGATTSPLHTAVKVAPCYSGAVVHVRDASVNPIIANKLLNSNTKESFTAELKAQQELLRQSLKTNSDNFISLSEANDKRLRVNWDTYAPISPKKLGIGSDTITVSDARKYINWRAFFAAWKLDAQLAAVADIVGCDCCKASWLASFAPGEVDKAAEAMQLYKEANKMLDYIESVANDTIAVKYGIYKAYSENNDIVICDNEQQVTIPTLRQQLKSDIRDTYLALSDFIAPKDKNDYIGVFAITSGEQLERMIAYNQEKGDEYTAIMYQTLADRLAEAATELFHYHVRHTLWGYSTDEAEQPKRALQGHYTGIRPAVGYPSLPDQSLIFELDKLLHYNEIGIRITENGAMAPAASVSGLIIANPESTYFHIGKIDDEQRECYSDKRGFSSTESNKWLSV